MSEDKTTTSVKSAKKPIGDATTQRYLPFAEIRDNVMLMKDGSSRMVLKVHAVNFNLKSTEEQDALIYAYQRFLNSLRFPIQIVARSLKVDIESYVNKLKNLAIKQTNTLLQEQTYRYIDFLVNLIDMAQIMRKEFYIIVPYDGGLEATVRKVGIVGLFQNFWSAITQEESILTIREKRSRAENLKKGNLERVNMLKSSLEGIGLKSEEVKKDDLVKLLISYYNPKVNTDIAIRGDVGKFNME